MLHHAGVCYRDIARELVRGHGGDLSLIDSTHDGTWFRIVLPLS